MAITRTQIAKQLLANGGRTGFFEAGLAAGDEISPGTAASSSKSGPRGRGGPPGTDTSPPVDPQVAKLKAEVNKFEKEKLEERLEKFRRLGSNQRKFQDYLTKVSPIAMFASKFGPLNTRDFFTDKVLGSKNFANMTKEQFANLTNKEQEELFDSYMEGRMSGLTDAYGNEINRDDRGDPNILLPQGIMTQAPSITEQEPEEEDEGLRLAFRADGGPIGGEYDFESARQMYGLGKLVKKVTRTVKKIAKSPVGKIAIGAAILGTPFGAGAKGTGFFGSKSLFGRGLGFIQGMGVNKALLGTSDYQGGPTGLLSLIRDNPLTSIFGASALAGLLTPEQEEEAQELARGEGIDIEAARRSILNAGTAQDFRARRFVAEGGSMKEPVAKKTMPLLDLEGQEMDLRAEGGFVPIGRMEKADDVPARLSKNEFVFTADAVRNAGDGNVDKGAEVMYNMMKNLEAGGDISEESQGLEGARKMFQTSQRLEEVL